MPKKKEDNAATEAIDHTMQHDGVRWEEATDAADFSPYMPENEYQARIGRARDLLVRHGIDAMVLFAYGNKQYYAGFMESNYRFTDKWRHCLIVSQDHEPVFVGEAVLNSNLTKTTWIRDIRLWSAIRLWRLPGSFMDLLVDTIHDLGLANKVIGMEHGPGHMMQASYGELREIERRLPDARFVAADPLIWQQRMIKTDWEITLYREFMPKVQRVWEAGYNAIRPGIPEQEVHRKIWLQMAQEDLYNTPSWHNPQLFMCGTDAPGRWRLVTPPFYHRVIQSGDQGFADGGVSYKGYCSDVQRCFYVGDKLPPQLEDLSRWGRDAYLNTVANIRPGMRGCDVFKMAEKEVYRQDWNQLVPIDFVGHSIGSLTHEPPFMAEDDTTELRPGMILCIEVGCFGSDLVWFGNMPEDIYLVTETGLELLGMDLPRDIWLCG